MNFKFLLLSFCLTLKVTKVKSVVIAPMAAIFGAFSVVDTITLLLEIFNDKDDRVFELLTEYKNDVQQSNKLINDQIKEIKESVTTSTIAILSEIKASEIQEYISYINVMADELAAKLKVYYKDKPFMRQYIKETLGAYELEAPDTNLIKTLDAAFLGTTSLINVYIQFLRDVTYEQTFNMRATTNKNMYDFYISILLVVGKSHGLRETYQVLEDSYAGGNFERNTSRIYERYSLEDKWYGIHGFRDYDYSAPMYTGFDGLWECEHCRCICDQIHHVNNVNLFYVGKIEVEQEGYVITGVRFARHKKTVYLEIESGKILPMGLINSSTLSWHGPPQDIDTNVARFDFVNRAFQLDKVSIKNGFLSGFQMFQERTSLRLRVFSKKFQSFFRGRISDTEEILYDNENKTRIYCQDKMPLISKRPGKISTNWKYDVFFGTSNQVSDAGQTMVPFFDTTDITFNVKAPLGGIGFFHHSSSSDYAGYIRPIIYSLDYKSLGVFSVDDDPYG
ncbi:unnamed protein product [Diamesa tonsa]